VKTLLSLHPGAVASLYNTSLLEGTFPGRWKRQKLLLLPKPEKPAGEASSYRTICLLDTIGKVFERVIATRLNAAMEDAGGLSYGWKGRTKKYCLVVTLDIRNAFNSADWGRTLEALRSFNTSEYLLNVVHSYLSKRELVHLTR